MIRHACIFKTQCTVRKKWLWTGVLLFTPRSPEAADACVFLVISPPALFHHSLIDRFNALFHYSLVDRFNATTTTSFQQIAPTQKHEAKNLHVGLHQHFDLTLRLLHKRLARHVFCGVGG